MNSLCLRLIIFVICEYLFIGEVNSMKNIQTGNDIRITLFPDSICTVYTELMLSKQLGNTRYSLNIIWSVSQSYAFIVDLERNSRDSKAFGDYACLDDLMGDVESWLDELKINWYAPDTLGI